MIRSDRKDLGKLLLIGYGNDLRRDDGAGPYLARLLADALEEDGIPVSWIAVHQLTPELSLDLAAEDLSAAIFVDTRAGRGDGDEIVISEIANEPDSLDFGHTCNPATLLVYAGKLFGSRPRAWLLTVPGYDFEHGEGFSPALLRCLNDSDSIAERLIETVMP